MTAQYPGAIPTYSSTGFKNTNNIGKTTLAISVDASITTWIVSDPTETTTWPTTNFDITCGTEVATCTSRSGNTLTIIRGPNAAAHSVGDVVRVVLSSETISKVQDEIVALATKIGITGAENFPPATRTITAGTGLSGGGDLTTNRTLSADQTFSPTWTGTHSFQDTKLNVVDVTDSTKIIKFDSSGTTGTSTTIQSSQTTNKIITLPDATDTLLAKNTTDVLTNKTATSITNNITAKSIHSATTVVDVSSATAPTNGQVLTATSSTTATWQTPTGGSGTVAVKDEGTSVLASATTFNFVGAGVTATDGGSGTATITIPGAGTATITVENDDVNLSSVITNLDFRTDGVGVDLVATETPSGEANIKANLDINGLTADATPDKTADYVATYDASATTSKKVLLTNLPATVVIQDEGSGTSAAHTLNFVGANVSASVTTGTATITVTGSGGTGITWNEVTGTTQTAAINNGYVLNNAALVTLTLPSTASLGDIIAITGKGAGGWRLAQNANQIIHFGNVDTTTGTGGKIESTHRRDSLELVCVVSGSSTEYNIRSSVGVLAVT